MIIAIFSFIVAPLLQYAPDGLWQIIRIFTGFYNIPVIAVVLVGLFTRNVPALAAKVAIIFHVIAYTLLKFVWDVDINFIHIYAILFVLEVAIMLAIGHYRPTTHEWTFEATAKVNMVPWRYAKPVSYTMLSAIALLYLLFSPIGLVGGITPEFWGSVVAVLVANFIVCWQSLKRYDRRAFEMTS